MKSAQQFVRLTLTELRLVVREPVVLVFVFFFPVLISLVLGGVFDADDSAFDGAPPVDYYTAAYVAVSIGAIGLIMLPVHVASYRERGVLRRFRVSGLPQWMFPASLGVVGLAAAVVGTAMVVLTMSLAYGTSMPDDLARTTLFGLLGAISFISFGLFLGWVMPNARAAQGLGMTAFIPMFMLGGGGPPAEALSDTMNNIARLLPLTHVMRAIQEPWLGAGNAYDHLAILVLLGVLSTVGWIVASRVSFAD